MKCCVVRDPGKPARNGSAFLVSVLRRYSVLIPHLSQRLWTHFSSQIATGRARPGMPMGLSEKDTHPFFQRALWKLGAHVDFNYGLLDNAPALLFQFLRHPGILLECPLYGLYRLWELRRWIGRFLLHLVLLQKVQIRPLLIVVHKFMSPTPLGRERLSACVFKLPVDGKIVSMCQMNATPLRRNLNLCRLRAKPRPGR